ncbi:hypothetical protein ACQ4PT_008177 [Festuca glaucescens]
MGRSPCCCHDTGVKKGPWTEEEDKALVEHIQKRGGHVGSWRGLPKASGLNRCGKSCRLRWTNYLRPDIKRGNFTDDEERLIISLHAALGNKYVAVQPLPAPPLTKRGRRSRRSWRAGRTTRSRTTGTRTSGRSSCAWASTPSPTSSCRPTTTSTPPPPPSSPRALLWAATLGGGLDTGAIMQAQLLQQLLHAIGSNNTTTNLIANLAASNAMLNSGGGIVPNLLLQDQMNMLSTGANYLQPGYLSNISSFAGQDVVQKQQASS